MPLDETFTNLAAFLNSLDAEGEQKFELSHSLVIICPDCGKNIAFRGRCPKCAGNSWIPAGHTGGIFERTKAQRLRRMIADEDVTMRGSSADSAPDVPVTGSTAAGTGDAAAFDATQVDAPVPASEAATPPVATDGDVAPEGSDAETRFGRKRRKRGH